MTEPTEVALSGRTIPELMRQKTELNRLILGLEEQRRRLNEDLRRVNEALANAMKGPKA